MKNFALLTLSLAAIAVSSALTASPAQAASRAEVRREIREMPLLARPNRPGHFYGNNVRRIHQARSG